MNGPRSMLDAAVDLVGGCREIMQAPALDPIVVRDAAAALDQVASRIDAHTESWRDTVTVCVETAAWLRLAAGLLRGEDVPRSIHTAAGEDAADTARWKKWRVS